MAQPKDPFLLLKKRFPGGYSFVPRKLCLWVLKVLASDQANRCQPPTMARVILGQTWWRPDRMYDLELKHNDLKWAGYRRHLLWGLAMCWALSEASFPMLLFSFALGNGLAKLKFSSFSLNPFSAEWNTTKKSSPTTPTALARAQWSHELRGYSLLCRSDVNYLDR